MPPCKAGRRAFGTELVRNLAVCSAKPRSENVTALTAYRHHGVIALMTDIGVAATAGLVAVNQERNIADVDRHRVRDSGGAVVGEEGLPEPADAVLQDPSAKNREVLVAAQRAEEARKRRLRGRQPSSAISRVSRAEARRLGSLRRQSASF